MASDSDALAAPVTDGLIISLDFGLHAAVEAEWGNIVACQGADGTVARAVQLQPKHRPIRIWKNGRYAARFIAGKQHSLDLTSALDDHPGVFAGPHTIVVLTQLVGSNSGCVIDVARAAGAVASLGADRSALIVNGNIERWCFRQGGTTVDAVSMEPIEVGRPELLIGCRSSTGIVTLTRNGVPSEARSASSPAQAPDVLTLGARMASGEMSMFLDGYVWRLLVYDRLLSVDELGLVTHWGQSALS